MLKSISPARKQSLAQCSSSLCWGIAWETVSEPEQQPEICLTIKHCKQCHLKDVWGSGPELDTSAFAEHFQGLFTVWLSSSTGQHHSYLESFRMRYKGSILQIHHRRSVSHIAVSSEVLVKDMIHTCYFLEVIIINLFSFLNISEHPSLCAVNTSGCQMNFIIHENKDHLCF